MRRFSLKLPVIPEPESGTRVVFIQPPSSTSHPFLKGGGPADLLCGKCAFQLARGIGSGQIENLVLKCPKCESFNDVPFVPALEQFVSELLLAPNPPAKALQLKYKLEAARDAGASPEFVSTTIQADSDVLAKFVALLEPKSAGDFYSMLGCIIAFLAFLTTLKQISSPQVVVNQYITSQTAPPSPRNGPCPCGSGKKFKHCHGRRK